MRVKELERVVSQLEPSDFREFRSWMADYDMILWDKQIESDSAEGRLDELIDKAMEDYGAGKCYGNQTALNLEKSVGRLRDAQNAEAQAG